ncbi:MAG: glycosyltransferase [Patescibacteria group bacterium]
MEVQKRKILFVITKSNWGGAQRYVYDLATALPRDKFDVSVAFGGTGEKNAQPGKLEEKLREAGIRTIFIKSFMRDISLGKEITAFFELYKIFRKEKPDVVHLNSSKAGGTGALAARLARTKKIIFTSHGLAYDEKRNIFAKAAIWLATWITFLLSTDVIVISKDNKARAKTFPFCKHKIVLIYNGISPIYFESGEKIRKSFPEGAYITGTIGELNRNKNQIQLIIEAKNNPDMYVAIVGNGENFKMLEEKIKDFNLESRVRLFGFMEAREALKGFDQFALPSIKEGLPYVLLEAKQAGLPIVASRVGGVGEILDSRNQEEFSLAYMIKQTANLYENN